MTRPLTLACAALLGAGCAHTTPEEMTAEEHRAEVVRHEQAAIAAETQYDPKAWEITPPRGPFSSSDGTSAVRAENPTAHHLRAADAQYGNAAEHAEAAKALEAAETQACGSLSPGMREACPLWRAIVRQAEETPRGVRLHLKSGVDAQALLANMQCHLAHGRAHGYAGGCPLVVPGAAVTQTGPGTLELRGDSARSAAAIKEEALRVLGPMKVAQVGR